MTGSLVPADLKALPVASREHQVTLYLENARDRLSLAVEMTGPEAVASIKAELATMAEATKQLGLSKEIRDDATEMVRRAQYALGKAIRKGQAEGTVRCHGNAGSSGGRGRVYEVADDATPKASPYDFATHGELYGDGRAGGNGVYAMAEATDDQFEDALAEAKDEGNLSRANIVRKVNDVKSPETRDMRAKRVAELAASGHDRHQIASALGIHRQSVVNIAKDYGITIRADAVTGKTQGRRNDDATVLANCLVGIESTETILGNLNLGKESLDDIDSLIRTATAIARKARLIQNQIKESMS